jgi:hypothetical protein
MNDAIQAAWSHALTNGDFICVETYSGYRSSIRDPSGPQHLLQPSAGDDEVGLAILDCLSHSRFVTPREDAALFDYELGKQRYSRWVGTIMTKYRYTTKRALFKNMKSCGIECCDGLITIRPSHHDKLEGWSGEGIRKEDYAIIRWGSNPVAIGAALRLAFDRCT